MSEAYIYIYIQQKLQGNNKNMRIHQIIKDLIFLASLNKHLSHLCPSPVLGKLGGHQVALALDPAVQMFRPTSEAWGHGGLHGARPAVVVVAAPAAHLGHFGREKSGETSRVNHSSP